MTSNNSMYDSHPILYNVSIYNVYTYKLTLAGKHDRREQEVQLVGNGYILSIDLGICSMAANYSPLHLENMPDFQKPAIQFKELVLLCRYIIKVMAGLLTSDGPDLIQQHPLNTSFCQESKVQIILQVQRDDQSTYYSRIFPLFFFFHDATSDENQNL